MKKHLTLSALALTLSAAPLTHALFDGALQNAKGFCTRAAAFVELKRNPKICANDPAKVMRLLARGHTCGFDQGRVGATLIENAKPCLQAFITAQSPQTPAARRRPQAAADSVQEAALKRATNGQLIPMLLSVSTLLVNNQSLEMPVTFLISPTTLQIILSTYSQKTKRGDTDPLLKVFHDLREEQYGSRHPLEAPQVLKKDSSQRLAISVPASYILKFLASCVETTNDSDTGLKLKDTRIIKELFLEWVFDGLTKNSKEKIPPIGTLSLLPKWS